MRDITIAAVLVVLSLAAACGAGAPRGGGTSANRAAAPSRQPAGAIRDDSWRSTAPVRGRATSFVPPSATALRLTNGVRVIVLENHASPLVALRIIAPQGASDVPGGKQGLAYVVVQMLTQGSATRDAATFGRDLAKLGARISADAGPDGSFLTVEALAENLDDTLDIVAEALRRPRLDLATLRTVRAVVVSEARAELARGRRAGLTAVGLVFLGPGANEAYPAMGHESGLQRIRVADVEAFYRSTFDPGRLTIVVAGDVAPADMRAKLQARLGDWVADRRRQVAPPRTPAPPRSSATRRLILVDRPHLSQVDLVAGIDGTEDIDRTSADWAALAVMNHALGGMYGSRLNLLLRETKGYTYAFRSFLERSRRLGQLSLRTTVRTEVAVAALDDVLAELRRFLSEPPDREEVDRARRVLLSRAARRFTTNADSAAAFDDIVLYGLPLDYWAGYVRAVSAVSASDVDLIAHRVLVEDRLTVAMVGPVGGLAQSLAARGWKTERLDSDGRVRQTRHER